MSDPPIITQLRAKQAELEVEIDRLTTRLAEVRVSVIHVVGTIRLLDPSRSDDAPPRVYEGASKVMKRSRLFGLCRTILRAFREPMDTRQLARAVIGAEGWDIEDRTLCLTMSHKVGLTMARFGRRGVAERVGERDRAAVWKLVERAAERQNASVWRLAWLCVLLNLSARLSA